MFNGILPNYTIEVEWLMWKRSVYYTMKHKTVSKAFIGSMIEAYINERILLWMVAFINF